MFVMKTRLGLSFWQRDVLEVAPDLVGKVIVRATRDKLHATSLKTAIITEVEAYGGEEDKASHARFGKTRRNAVMYGEAGRVYMYLIYGMYWMLNVVTGEEGEAGAVLIRGIGVIQKSNLKNPTDAKAVAGRQNDRSKLKIVKYISGPGRVGRWLQLDGSFYGEDLNSSQRIWFEDTRFTNHDLRIRQTTRIGVLYAGEWAKKKWRWVLTK
jgi:DNA-3-methyladenine glycosylase